MENIDSLKKELDYLRSKNREQEVRLAELTDFADNVPMPLHWIDHSGIIIWANQAELEFLGYDACEYIGRHIGDFHTQPEFIEDILVNLYNDVKILDSPAILKHKDGSLRYVLISASGWRKDGEFMHSRCLTRDISEIERVKQEGNKLLEELKESESRLRLAIESTNLGTWEWSRERGDIYWSDECKKILGLTDRHIISFQTFIERINVEDGPIIQSNVARIAADCSTSSPIDITCRLNRFVDDKSCSIRIQATVFRNDRNEISRIIGTLLDVTDAVAADEQNATLAAIITSSNDAIVAKSMEGVITNWNQAAEKMFGFSADEITGQSIMTIIPDDRKEEEHYILSQLRRGNSVKHYETKRLTKSGALIDVSLTISPIRDQSGSIIGISKIARDITEKKLEEKRKNDFVAVVSHELKTPLTSVLLYTQLLVKKSALIQDESFFNMSVKIEAHVKRMTGMIGDYLGLSRIEEGKVDIRKEYFELFPLANEVLEECELISAKHTFEIVGCEAINLYADREKMRQILINLSNNAVKYSPVGGVVTLGCELAGDQIKIYVRDVGMGISKEHQQRLFQRFYRVNNEESKNISGFGIGLYLVAELLRLHDSEIKVQSEVGHGSTFYFYLASA
ncbi:PAS domain-containing sensor histidine kinase [Sphingobacterium sp. LRF_L2]|uniref:PAS domain-containing sensor histidine kinase n=1 Tax=Sphingobacterium sp. LRF_L2 TaxID=3369421 RepID=UPI003F646227